MAKIFISYRFTGEDPQLLNAFMRTCCNILEGNGHTTYCSLFEDDVFTAKKMSAKDIFAHTQNELRSCDVIFGIIKSNEPSKSMLLELKEAIKRELPYYLFIKEGLKFPRFRTAAKETREFIDIGHLWSILDGFEIGKTSPEV